ncbi:MAG: RNA polymerase sigma factor [Thermotaleaceae bacterium]
MLFINEEFKDTYKDKDNEFSLLMAMDNLKPTYKKVIILRYFEDFTISDISRIMDSPEGTIKTWIHRALGNLRDILNRGGDFNE